MILTKQERRDEFLQNLSFELLDDRRSLLIEHVLIFSLRLIQIHACLSLVLPNQLLELLFLLELLVYFLLGLLSVYDEALDQPRLILLHVLHEVSQPVSCLDQNVHVLVDGLEADLGVRVEGEFTEHVFSVDC